MRSRILPLAFALLAPACRRDITGADSGPGGLGIDDVPRTSSDALAQPLTGVYTDEGAAPESDEFRALMGFPLRNEDALAEQIRSSADPSDPNFRRYPTPSAWTDAYAPTETDVAYVSDWLTGAGFTVARVAPNRLLLEFTGSVGDFNAAFATNLPVCNRDNPQQGGDPIPVYCTLGTMGLPTDIASRVTGVVTADLPPDQGPLPGEAGSVVDDPPAGREAYTPADLATAYGVAPLSAEGYHGEGARLGLVIGGMFKFNDVGTFWMSNGITRADPVVIQTMEPVPSRNAEATLDVSWSGAMAPGADLIAYAGPDSRNTSLLYTFNEAIAEGGVDVLSDSFAHREDSEPDLLRIAYDESAAEGAALGITISSASGDTAGVDVPCDSPYVTCVGGTTLTMSDGRVTGEFAWADSGTGDSATFGVPEWQLGVMPSGATRAVNDVASSGGNEFYVYYLGNWEVYMGTSFASPVFAGCDAVVAGWRLAHGLPGTGYLNPLLYGDATVQASFRDVTATGSEQFPAGPGWDHPTGWGTMNAEALTASLP